MEREYYINELTNNINQLAIKRDDLAEQLAMTDSKLSLYNNKLAEVKSLPDEYVAGSQLVYKITDSLSTVDKHTLIDNTIKILSDDKAYMELINNQQLPVIYKDSFKVLNFNLMDYPDYYLMDDVKGSIQFTDDFYQYYINNNLDSLIGYLKYVEQVD